MPKVNKRRYKRFLYSDEGIPRSTRWRRAREIANLDSSQTEDIDCEAVNDCSEIDIDSFKAQENSDISYSESTENSERENSSCSETEGNSGSDNAISGETATQFKEVTYDTNPLYLSANVSNFEAYVSILAFTLRFNLSRTCVQELLQLLKLLLPPNNLPSTAHTFYNKTESAFDGVCEVHMYCINCKSYMCMLSDAQKPDLCNCCDQNFDPDECMKKGSFFLYMPLQPQLKLILEKQNIMADITKYRSNFEPGLGQHYKDVLDGDLYQAASAKFSDKDISLQFNIDGIPMYRKSQYSV